MREQATARKQRPTRKSAKVATDHRGDIPTKTPGVTKRGVGDAAYFTVRYTDLEGKRRRERFDDEDDAILFLAEVKRDIKQGTYRKVEPVTFAEYATDWCDTYRGRGRTPIRENTKETYRRQVQVAVAVLGGPTGRKPLAAITSQDIAEFIDHLFADGKKPETIKRYMGPVGIIMAQALREGRITTDPTKGIPLIPSDPSLMPEDDGEDQEPVKALDHDEVTRLLSAVPDDHRLMVRLMLLSGLRISEVLGLRWQDVDRAGSKVRVRQAVVQAKVGKPKSKRSRREVPVTDDIIWRDLAQRRLASQHSGDDDLVFGTATGKPAYANNHYRWLKPAMAEAGVGWAGFHNLRHTFASRLFHAGEKVTVVSKLLGHSSPSFTLERYIHVIPDDVPDGRDIATAIGL